MKKAIYPGSFDPVTLGHLNIIRRAAKLTDELTVVILNNNKKTPTFTLSERIRMLQTVTTDIPNVHITASNGLLVDFAAKTNADAIIRGLRAVTDFEYELQIAQTNHALNSNIETIFLTTNVEYAYTSSSTVREIASFHGDISKFVPDNIISTIHKKYQNLI